MGLGVEEQVEEWGWGSLGEREESRVPQLCLD